MIRSAEARARDRAHRAERYRERYRSDPVFRKKELARNRKRYLQSYKPISDRSRPALNEPRKPRKPRPRRTILEPRVPIGERMGAQGPHYQRRAPAEIRNAWGRAHVNSMIRQKYPTMRDLDKAAREGAFDGSRA